MYYKSPLCLSINKGSSLKSATNGYVNINKFVFFMDEEDKQGDESVRLPG
jgi:hypothetical protein